MDANKARLLMASMLILETSEGERNPTNAGRQAVLETIGEFQESR